MKPGAEHDVDQPPPAPWSRRGQIVGAVLELLATTPLERLTTRAIATAVGLSQPALFRHFASREALLVAVVEAAREEIGRVVEPILASGAAPLDACLALAEQLTRYIERKPGLPRLLFADVAREEPELRSALEQLVSAQRALVSSLVVAAIEDGSARPDVDPSAAATLFAGMLQGLALERDLGSLAADRIAPRAIAAARLWHAAVSAPAHDRRARPQATRRAAVALDVRPQIARKEDPLVTILRTIDGLAPSSLLVVVAPFRPKPLEAALAARGHVTAVFEDEDGAFNVACVVGGAPAILDLRELPQPEPLERVLTRCAHLEPGGVLIAHLPRHPRMLLPQLARRGLHFEVVDLTDGTALLRVERP